MISLWLIPIFLQGLGIFLDEVLFHRKRGLPLWEKIGHPVDSFCFLACLSVPFLAPLESGTLKIYVLLSCLSCLMITKDEWVHKKRCTAEEHWLHAVLFILHPVILIETLFLWASFDASAGLLDLPAITLPDSETAKVLLLTQWGGVSLFLIYQIFSGIFSRKPCWEFT